MSGDFLDESKRALDRLNANELRALSDFSKRINSLPNHKEAVSYLVKKLEEYNDLIEKKKNEYAEESRSKLINILNSLEENIERTFFSVIQIKGNNNIAELKTIPKAERAIIENQLQKCADALMTLKNVEGQAPKEIIAKLNEILQAEKKGKELITEFEARLKTSIGILEQMSNRVNEELSSVRNIKDSLKNGTLIHRKEIIKLEASEAQIEGDVREEKNTIQDLFSVYTGETNADRSAKQIIALLEGASSYEKELEGSFDNLLTQDDYNKFRERVLGLVRGDLSKMNHPSQYLNYKNHFENLCKRLPSPLLTEILSIISDPEIIKKITSYSNIAKGVEETEMRADTDPLTGLYNRGYMNKKLLDTINLGIERKLPLHVILIDIDHFKSFNDTYGHDVGDEVLKTVSDILRSTVRQDREIKQSDIVGTAGDLHGVSRWGGEEFIILSITGDYQAECKRIMYNMKFGSVELIKDRNKDLIKFGEQEKVPRVSLRNLFRKKKRVDYITVSIGVSSLMNDINEDERNKGDYQKIISELVKVADKRLYDVKRNGRDGMKGPDEIDVKNIVRVENPELSKQERE